MKPKVFPRKGWTIIIIILLFCSIPSSGFIIKKETKTSSQGPRDGMLQPLDGGFIKPGPQDLYIRNRYIGFFPTCVIIGDIELQAETIGDDKSFVTILFIIDDRVVASFTPNESNFYTWMWKRGEPPLTSLFFHFLEFKIIYDDGVYSTSFPLWRFF